MNEVKPTSFVIPLQSKYIPHFPSLNFMILNNWLLIYLFFLNLSLSHSFYSLLLFGWAWRRNSKLSSLFFFFSSCRRINFMCELVALYDSNHATFSFHFLESLFPGSLFTNMEHRTFEAQTIVNGSQRNKWKSKKWMEVKEMKANDLWFPRGKKNLCSKKYLQTWLEHTANTKENLRVWCCSFQFLSIKRENPVLVCSAEVDLYTCD